MGSTPSKGHRSSFLFLLEFHDSSDKLANARKLPKQNSTWIEVPFCVPGCISWTPSEAALLSAAAPRLFYTTLATVTGWADRYPAGAYFIERHCTDPATAGHCVAFQRFHARSDVFLFWSYGAAGAAAAADDVSRLLRADVAAMGGAIAEVHAQRAWKYCYQLPTQGGPRRAVFCILTAAVLRF